MIKDIIIGKCIEQRINELGMSKSEFAKKIGVLQPNVGRILESDNIKTDKLVEISNALGFNFFQLYGSNGSEKTTLLNVKTVRQLIFDKGISEIDLASKLGITRSVLANIFDGGDLSLRLVEKMAEALGVQPAELINGTSSTAEAKPINNSAMYEELIALRAENKVLREIQGLSSRSQVHVG
ncbi:helix-turn-helix transcriptional regulator [Leyella stercorea]|uniref:helix-turn-helix transcriptional regulator n=1 Tax=Leyella stercorea TaxID=363265 RepID=UPI00242E9A67|nr:helix-turn-helix transcriptional regulator [Leyella stercorea]